MAKKTERDNRRAIAEQPVKLLKRCPRRSMLEDAGRSSVRVRPLRPHAADEQVEHAAEMVVVVVAVAGHPMREVAVERQRIDQVLQMIAVLDHRRLHRFAAVVVRRVAEMI